MDPPDIEPELPELPPFVGPEAVQPFEHAHTVLTVNCWKNSVFFSVMETMK